VGFVHNSMMDLTKRSTEVSLEGTASSVNESAAAEKELFLNQVLLDFHTVFEMSFECWPLLD